MYSIYIDHQQNIWLGTNQGVALFNQRTEDFIVYKHDSANPNSLIADHIYDIKEMNDGTLWIGSDIGGISILDLYNFGPVNPGIVKFTNITAAGKSNDLSSGNIRSLLQDSFGNIWIGNYSSGIDFISYMPSRFLTLPYTMPKANHYKHKPVWGIYADKDNQVWVGSENEVVMFKDNRKQRTIDISCFQSRPYAQIFSMTGNKQGIILLGLYDDTARTEKCNWYGTEQALANRFVRAIQEDNRGNIWLSTNQGISLWNKVKQQFYNYNHLDGIPSGNFIEGSACLTADGTVYFGSLNGVCYFNPQDILTRHAIAPVQIIDCKGFHKRVESSNAEFLIPISQDKINLKYNQNSFRISFSVPDYSQSMQVEYAYSVEGLDAMWSNTLGENHVTFRSLPPGEYTFKVKARLKNHEWDEGHIAAMKIHIHPPLWLTWYAKLVYFAIGCIAILIFLQSYKHRLELKSSLEVERTNSLNEQNLNQERLRFYTNITHELRTPLTLILGPLEDLTNDKNLPPQYSKIINTIHGSALRLLNLINQILEFRKTETLNRKLTVTKGNIASRVIETGLRFKELNQNPHLSIHIDIQTEHTEIYFDADVIVTILNNLLSNAVKYTPEGRVTLTLESVKEDENEYTQIKISDTGCGIEQEALTHIFDRYYQAQGKHQASGTGIGLALVKSLATLHEGELHVESTVGKGSTFIFRLLTGNSYPHALHYDVKQGDNELTTSEGGEDESAAIRQLLLVVEDSDEIRQYIKTSFESEYTIIEAKNGKEGLELATTHIPDIIVSDIMMPQMDGIEFCRTVKEDMRTSHIPVILLTAKDSLHDKEEGYESGADSYLTKPFSSRLLRVRIQNLLELRKRLARQITVGIQKEEPSQETLKMSKLDEEFLPKLTNLIEQNFSTENLDIPFMTRHMNMSATSFYRKVKGLTGVSANEFIRKIKLQNSRKLLLSGDYNISETAYMTGFNNLSHFRQCFKKEYGMTPSEFLKEKK